MIVGQALWPVGLRRFAGDYSPPNLNHGQDTHLSDPTRARPGLGAWGNSLTRSLTHSLTHSLLTHPTLADLLLDARGGAREGRRVSWHCRGHRGFLHMRGGTELTPILDSESFYDILGVTHDANFAEIRKAYRRAALINHPDKNPGDRQAEARFLRISQAYEVLSDPAKRAHYDRGGTSTGIDNVFDFGRASAMFDANFGESLMRQWRPGMTISGTLVQNGKRIKITIHPDGTTEESEGAGGGAYRSTTTTLPGGGTMKVVQFEGSLGENLAAMLVPASIAGIPLLGRAVTNFVSYLPTLVFGYFCLRFLGLA